MRSLSHFTALPGSTFFLLSLAAFLEVLGDSFFQSALHRSSGTGRSGFFFLGAAVLALYGTVVNLPEWDFGRLLGVYVVFFFLAAQVVARLRFHQQPTLPTLVGGAFIITGGLIATFWKS